MKKELARTLRRNKWILPVLTFLIIFDIVCAISLKIQFKNASSTVEAEESEELTISIEENDDGLLYNPMVRNSNFDNVYLFAEVTVPNKRNSSTPKYEYTINQGWTELANIGELDSVYLEDYPKYNEKDNSWTYLYAYTGAIVKTNDILMFSMAAGAVSPELFEDFFTTGLTMKKEVEKNIDFFEVKVKDLQLEKNTPAAVWQVTHIERMD